MAEARQSVYTHIAVDEMGETVTTFINVLLISLTAICLYTDCLASATKNVTLNSHKPQMQHWCSKVLARLNHEKDKPFATIVPHQVLPTVMSNNIHVMTVQQKPQYN